MLLNITLLFIFLTAGAVSFLIYLYYKLKKQPLRVPKPIFLIGILFIILFGFMLTPIFSFQLADAFATSKWPSVQGTIVSSKVVGGRAFRPDIQYDYTVENQTFTGSSYLNSPGFGGRMNRLDAAEKLVHLYPAGKSIKVFYNPDNHGDSTLSPHPTYSHYLKFGTSAFLLWIGMLILFTYGFTKNRFPKPIYKERI